MTNKMKLIIIISLAVIGVGYFIYDYTQNKKGGAGGDAINATDEAAFQKIYNIMKATDPGALNWIMDIYIKDKDRTDDPGTLLANGKTFKTGRLARVVGQSYIGYDFSKIADKSPKHEEIYKIFSDAKNQINAELGLY